MEYDFKTIQNIDCYNTDFCVKVRHGMRYWNMTVQWWLHHYIYPNAPFRAYALRYEHVHLTFQLHLWLKCAIVDHHNLQLCFCLFSHIVAGLVGPC